MSGENKVTTEYGVQYTEVSAFDGRHYPATVSIGSTVALSEEEAAQAAQDRASRVREYQAREGLPVDAVAVTCTVTVTPWAPLAAGGEA